VGLVNLGNGRRKPQILDGKTASMAWGVCAGATALTQMAAGSPADAPPSNRGKPVSHSCGGQSAWSWFSPRHPSAGLRREIRMRCSFAVVRLYRGELTLLGYGESAYNKHIHFARTSHDP
jgi:hypothetical protein